MHILPTNFCLIFTFFITINTFVHELQITIFTKLTSKALFCLEDGETSINEKMRWYSMQKPQLYTVSRMSFAKLVSVINYYAPYAGFN